MHRAGVCLCVQLSFWLNSDLTRSSNHFYYLLPVSLHLTPCLCMLRTDASLHQLAPSWQNMSLNVYFQSSLRWNFAFCLKNTEFGHDNKAKKYNQLELTVNWYFTLKNRLMGHPSFLLVHMWVGLNSADLRDRRQKRSRNSGAYSPQRCSQWFVIWPFNICCKLTDLCTVKRKKERSAECCVLLFGCQNRFSFPWQFTVSEEEILGNVVDLLF